MAGPVKVNGGREAIWLALILLLVLVAVLVVETARGNPTSGGPPPRAASTINAIRAEFGTGWLGGCFLGIAYRETGGTYNPRAANWTDHHTDGSVGSFGALQIGALWRDRGESVAAFARRMYDPHANAALAHRIYDRYGLQPWGGSCG